MLLLLRALAIKRDVACACDVLHRSRREWQPAETDAQLLCASRIQRRWRMHCIFVNKYLHAHAFVWKLIFISFYFLMACQYNALKEDIKKKIGYSAELRVFQIFHRGLINTRF